MSANLVKIPIDPVVLFDQITAAHNLKMASYETIYECCDPETEEGLAVMTEIESLVTVEADSYRQIVEMKEQNKDLQLKNTLLTGVIETLKEHEQRDLERMQSYETRVSRLKEHSQKKTRDSRNNAAWDRVMRTAHQSARRS